MENKGHESNIENEKRFYELSDEIEEMEDYLLQDNLNDEKKSECNSKLQVALELFEVLKSKLNKHF